MNLADSGAVMAGSEQRLMQQEKYISLTMLLTVMCRVDSGGKELGRGE